jgi:uncharacterized Zn finger protein
MALFTERDLIRLGGPERLDLARAFADQIDDLYEDEYSLCATISDGQPYLAMLHHRVGRLWSECECPNGEPGGFCVHSLAVGLCYLDEHNV